MKNGVFAVVTGTRPEIIKMFPIMNEMNRRAIDYKYIFTGQHFDSSLSYQFFNEFSIPEPDYKLDLVESRLSPSLQIPEIMTKLDSIMRKEKFEGVIVQGDTNSVLAAALISTQHNIPIYHVESGLRCFDYRMQEERNRFIVDHLSEVLFAATNISKSNLQNERVEGKIYTVGNTVMDAIKLILSNSNNTLRNKIFIHNKYDNNFVLVTLHRYENLTNRNFLLDFFKGLHESKMNYVLPIHPHTLKQMKKQGLEYLLSNRIKIIPPLGYSKFLGLLRKCKFVITDSGGIQEEITSNLINKCALVVRPNTERPESIGSGHCRLISEFSKDRLLREIYQIDYDLENGMVLSDSPYGMGNSSEKIVKILIDNYKPISKIAY